MDDVIRAVGQALSTDVNGINAISHNVANLNTPGYQRIRPAQEFSRSLEPSSRMILGDGPLKQTQRTLDLGMRGQGFFVVKDGNRTLLTRAGNFTRDAEGRLATRFGEIVMTDLGELRLPEGEISIDDAGVIWNGSSRIAALSVVDVADDSRLVPTDGGYEYDGELVAWKGRVLQGAMELSNVDAAEQVLLLMELTRHVESTQRALSIYDRMLDSGINRIGEN